MTSPTTPDPGYLAALDQDRAERSAHVADLLDRFPELGERTIDAGESVDGAEIRAALDFEA